MNNIIKLTVVLLSTILSSCASTPDGGFENNDPFESFNRASYSFTSAIDKAIIKPAAQGYDTVTPKPVKTAVSNFFSNLDEIPTIFNDLLQGKISDAYTDTWRFIINTSLGLAGFIDVATDLGLEQHDEDFGQTLGVWGIDTGPYIVIPLLGPSTIRGTLASPVDSSYSLTRNISHIRTRNSIYALDLLDLRYRLLALDSQLEDTLDEYSFVRDAYLMRLKYQVYDGNPPEDDDFYEDECYEDEEECGQFEEID